MAMRTTTTLPILTEFARFHNYLLDIDSTGSNGKGKVIHSAEADKRKFRYAELRQGIRNGVKI